MVAILIDGEPITEKNGGPVRLIVPKMYAYKSVKWLNRIELIDMNISDIGKNGDTPKTRGFNLFFIVSEIVICQTLFFKRPAIGTTIIPAITTCITFPGMEPKN
jgi:DMSO/TMAO reductase YedYZ molybdopterin-dependent catalytic subunit